MQFDRGYKSPYFVTNNTTMQAVLEDPYILIYDGRITTAAELLNALTKANSENKSLLIVAEDIEGEALATLIVNKMRGIVQVAAVKAPDFGERRTLILEDLAILTGGQVISKDKGHKLDKLAPVQLGGMLGKARTATISKDETTIVDGIGTAEVITARAEEIKEQIEKATSFYEKEKLQERLGKLVGGVAIISVGGNSDIEIKEKKDRVEDALNATVAAAQEGIVPGGGSALFYAQKEVENQLGENTSKGWGEDFRAGVQVILNSCKVPLYTIVANTGKSPEVVMDKLSNHRETAVYHTDKAKNQENKRYGYDAANGEYGDLIDKGIIDPVKVTRYALEHATSVVGLMLTCNAVVLNEKDKSDS
jgi:chaperonin GroEL